MLSKAISPPNLPSKPKVISPPNSPSKPNQISLISNPFEMPDLFRGLVIMGHQINVMGILFGIVQKQLINTTDRNVFLECRRFLSQLGLYVSFNDTYITIRKQLSDEDLNNFRLKNSIIDIKLDKNKKIKSFSLKIRVIKFHYKNQEQTKIILYEIIKLVIGNNTFPHVVFDYDYANQCLKYYGLKMTVFIKKENDLEINNKENTDIINISYIDSNLNVADDRIVDSLVVLDSKKLDSPKKSKLVINFNDILLNCVETGSIIEFTYSLNQVNKKLYTSCTKFAVDKNYTFSYQLLDDDVKLIFIKN